MGAITVSGLERFSIGDRYAVKCVLTFTGLYSTGGESLTPSMVGLSRYSEFIAPTVEGGYLLGFDYTLNKVLVYDVAGSGVTISSNSAGTPAGTNGTSAVTGTGAGTVTPLGTNSASAVTGTGTYTDGATSGALNLASPAFSGTGFSTAGQVVTTTDNQTMTLNQCAGMWLIADGLPATAPVLIVSNTAVSGAPAVLTVIGAAPATDAGTYKIVKNLTVGTVSALSGTAAAQVFVGDPSAVTVSSLSGTAAAQVFTGTPMSTHTHTAGGASSLGEVPNGTDLTTALAAVEVLILGF